MMRRLIVLMLTLAALAPVRPAAAACTTQKDHHCGCRVELSAAKCCCTGQEIPGKTQSEAPPVPHADPGLLPAAVGSALVPSAVAPGHTSPVERPIEAPSTPLFLLTGSFLS